jgi:hypothetical protein
VRMLGTEFRGWELIKTVTMHEDKDVTEKVYLWQNKSNPGREMVRVSITERHDWRLAQESLREYLNHCMRPDITRGTKNLASVGDVNFAGREPQTDIPAAVSFTRGNVTVTVSSAGEKTVDVSEMTAMLDRALSEAPTKAAQDKGLVEARAPKTVAVEPGKAQILIENLQKASKGGAWLKIIAPDGELSRKDDALIYVSPEGGKKPIGIYAVRGG